jgi:hypothetical protein
MNEEELNPRRSYATVLGRPIGQLIENAVRGQVDWNSWPITMRVEHQDGSVSTWTLNGADNVWQR